MRRRPLNAFGFSSRQIIRKPMVHVAMARLVGPHRQDHVAQARISREIPVLNGDASRPSGVAAPDAADPFFFHAESTDSSGVFVSSKNGVPRNGLPSSAVASPNTSPHREAGA